MHVTLFTDWGPASYAHNVLARKRKQEVGLFMPQILTLQSGLPSGRSQGCRGHHY
jgi:hypothetical protein